MDVYSIYRASEGKTRPAYQIFRGGRVCDIPDGPCWYVPTRVYGKIMDGKTTQIRSSWEMLGAL